MSSASEPEAVSDLIRATERERLRSLVTRNLETANQLHADDFQLINPLGASAAGNSAVAPCPLPLRNVGRAVVRLR